MRNTNKRRTLSAAPAPQDKGLPKLVIRAPTWRACPLCNFASSPRKRSGNARWGSICLPGC
eukprot:10914083-Alexandrium_andersonii.AAC.1